MNIFNKVSKRVGFTLMAGALVASLIGCGSSTGTSNQTATTGAPKTGGTLKIARYGDATSFDPIVPTDNMSIWVVLNMFDQLVRVVPNGSGVEPDLATDWKVSADGKTYTFNLRKDVKFSDGSPVTAQDVKFSLDRVRSKDSSWSWLFAAIQSVDVTGDNQVTVKLNRLYAPFLSSLALFSASIVPEKVVKAKGAKEFANHPVGSGPFVLTDWQRGQKIVLKKNTYYWQTGKPYLDGVEFDQVAEDTTRVMKLQAGEVDVASPIPFSQVDTLKASGSLQVSVDPLARVDMININTTKAPFTDKKIRQAMNYAIDKDQIIKAVLFGNGQPSGSYLPAMKDFNTSIQNNYKVDIAKAKQLMSESSQPNGFKTTLKITAGDDIGRQVAVIVKEQLKQIGIDVQILQLDGGVKEQQVSSMNYDLAEMLLVSDIIDPDELTTFGVVSTGGINSYYTGYKNPKVDAMALQAQSELNDQKRQDLYNQIQKTVSDDAPFIFLYYTPNTSATQSYVKGFKTAITGSNRLEDVWLAK